MIEQVKKELLKARKDRNAIATNVLGLLLGEIQTASTRKDLTEEDELAIVKKIIKSNKVTLKSMQEEHEQFDVLTQENKILEVFLPQKMTIGDIAKFIVDEGIELDEASFGKSMGAVIKQLKTKKYEFDPKDVQKAIFSVKNK